MKVLLVNTFFDPDNYGGTETFVKQLALELIDRGFSVAVLTMNINDEARRIEHWNNGLTVFREREHWYGGAKNIYYKLRNMYNPTTFSTVKWVMENFTPDIIHFNNEYGFSKSIWGAFERYKIPMICTMHDSHWIDRGMKEKYVPFYYMWVRKKANSVFQTIVATSQFMLEAVVSAGFLQRDKLTLIWNGTYIDESFTARITNEKMKRNSRRVDFLYAGRLEDYKGIKVMLEAFDKLGDDDCYLHICGDGNLKDSVIDAERGNKHIKYYGKVSTEKINEIYDKCDVLIMPSIWEEPFGLILIEAASHGCALIGTGRGGSKEILDELGVKDRYRAESKEELRGLIEKFCDRNVIRKQIRENRKHIMRFSIKEQTDNYIGLYKKFTVNNERA